MACQLSIFQNAGEVLRVYVAVDSMLELAWASIGPSEVRVCCRLQKPAQAILVGIVLATACRWQLGPLSHVPRPQCNFVCAGGVRHVGTLDFCIRKTLRSKVHHLLFTRNDGDAV